MPGEVAEIEAKIQTLSAEEKAELIRGPYCGSGWAG